MITEAADVVEDQYKALQINSRGEANEDTA